MANDLDPWNIRMLDLINRERLLNELLGILEGRLAQGGLSAVRVAYIDEQIADAKTRLVKIGKRIDNHILKDKNTFQTNKTMRHVEELEAAIKALKKLNVQNEAAVGMVTSVMQVLTEM